MSRSALPQWSFHIYPKEEVKVRVQKACSLETLVPVKETLKLWKLHFTRHVIAFVLGMNKRNVQRTGIKPMGRNNGKRSSFWVLSWDFKSAWEQEKENGFFFLAAEDDDTPVTFGELLDTYIFLKDVSSWLFLKCTSPYVWFYCILSNAIILMVFFPLDHIAWQQEAAPCGGPFYERSYNLWMDISPDSGKAQTFEYWKEQT